MFKTSACILHIMMYNDVIKRRGVFMNLQDDTIQLLVDLVEKEQRRLDLGLADLHGLINCRHKHFFFRAGVQLGLALGSIAVLQDR